MYDKGITNVLTFVGNVTAFGNATVEWVGHCLYSEIIVDCGYYSCLCRLFNACIWTALIVVNLLCGVYLVNLNT